MMTDVIGDDDAPEFAEPSYFVNRSCYDAAAGSTRQMETTLLQSKRVNLPPAPCNPDSMLADSFLAITTKHQSSF